MYGISVSSMRVGVLRVLLCDPPMAAGDVIKKKEPSHRDLSLLCERCFLVVVVRAYAHVLRVVPL